jgi:hypothetical protein
MKAIGVGVVTCLWIAGCGEISEEVLSQREQAVTGCGQHCEALCRLHFYNCMDECDSQTYDATCDLACVTDQVKCERKCQCTEECVTDYHCGPGMICVGAPGSRRCMFPPDPIMNGTPIVPPSPK